MVPWETCLDAVLGPETVGKVRKSSSKAGKAFAQAMELTVERIKNTLGLEGLLLCDLYCMRGNRSYSSY